MVHTPPSSANGLVATVRGHGYTARIAAVGAALVSLRHQGRALVREFDPARPRPVFSGAVLAPWPNRVFDASYRWDGERQQLAITEPERSNALHGLVYNTDFQLVDHGEDFVALRTLIPAQAGYPFALRVELDYRLTPAGLHAQATITNLGDAPAPFGWGSHSYLVAPGNRVDDWVLSLPAGQVQRTAGPRLLPAGVEPVGEAGNELDFTAARRIGPTLIDHAFTGLSAEPDGSYRASVTDRHGVGTRISWDAGSRWIQVHTADRPEAELNRTGLALEPMTCPPGALNDGTDLIILQPGARHELWWCIGALEPDAPAATGQGNAP